MHRILVVDDVPDMVEVLTFHLRRQGHEVLAAYGGQAALTLARDAAPDLILMDVSMPDLDGMEVCRRLKADPALVQIPAHEFKNLLQTIGGHAEYALRGLSPDDSRHEDLQQVMIAAKRASLLTRQLLGFSRRQPLRREPVDPNQLVHDATRLARPALPRPVRSGPFRPAPRPRRGRVNHVPCHAAS